MKKKILFAALAVIILLAGILAFIFLKKGKVFSPDNFKLQQVAITMAEDTLFLNLRIRVPDSDVAAWLLDSLRYSVYFDTTQFSEGLKVFDKQSPAFDTLIDLPLAMDKNRLFARIKEMQGKDSTYLNIVIQPYISTRLTGKRSISFDINRRMRVPIPPEVKLEKINIEEFSLKEATLQADLKIINLNDFEFMIWKGDIYLHFPELFYGKITLDEPLHLKNRDTSIIETVVNIEQMKLAKTAWRMAFNKDKITYKMEGTLFISTFDKQEDTIKVLLKSDELGLN